MSWKIFLIFSRPALTCEILKAFVEKFLRKISQVKAGREKIKKLKNFFDNMILWKGHYNLMMAHNNFEHYFALNLSCEDISQLTMRSSWEPLEIYYMAISKWDALLIPVSLNDKGRNVYLLSNLFGGDYKCFASVS